MQKAGVFVCRCGFNIAGVVDVERVAEAIENRGYFAKVIDYACSESGQKEIAECVKENGLERFVVAACSPKLHEKTFRRLAERVGVNPYMVAMANLREQCSWVHERNERTQKKAEELTLMALSRVLKARPLERRKLESVNKVVVVGGGVAGIEASLLLANSGIDVVLVEKRPSIGGHMALLNEIFPNNDCSICVLAPKMNEVWEHEKIKVYTNSEVEQVEGSAGKFRVRIRKKARFVSEDCKGCIEDCSSVCPVMVYDEFLGTFRKAIYLPFPQSTPLYAAIDEENCVRCDLCVKACEPKAIDFSMKDEVFEVEAGAIIVTTGYELFNPSKLSWTSYGKDGRIITLIELERLLSPSSPINFKEAFPKARKVAFIQCVGSRGEYNSHCSVVCCMASIKNALILRRRYNCDCCVFYIDLRACGRGYEEYFKKAMEEGVRFVRGKPSVELDSSVKLRYEDTLLSKVVEEEFDVVVLAVGMEGSVPSFCSTGRDGFIEVVHPKLRPVETSKTGIFVAGCASGPKDIRESVSSAGLAVAKVIEFFRNASVEPYVARVGESCSGCGVCEKLCPAGAVEVKKEVGGKAVVNENACQMCGLCVSACPEEAMDQGFYSNDELYAEISCVSPDSVIVFACNYCAYSALDLAGALRMSYDECVRVVRVPCSARVSVRMILEALKRARGVIVAGCRQGECHFGVNDFARKRVETLKRALGEESYRLESVWCSAGEADVVVERIRRFVKELERRQRRDI